MTLDVRDRYIRTSVVRWPTKFIACSEEIATDIRLVTPISRVFYLPIPVDFSEIESFGKRVAPSETGSGQNSTLDILYCGVVSKDKRVNLLLEAFQRVRMGNPERLLGLAGPVQDTSVLDPLPEGATYLGVLDREEVLTALSSARLVVVLGGFEGIPRVAIEAIALGTPVLLPPGISVFEESCSGSVLKDLSVNSIAEAFSKSPAKFRVDKFDLTQFDSTIVATDTVKIIEQSEWG